MKKKDFIMWLRGYITTIDKTKPIDQILLELVDEIEKLDLTLTEKVIERIIEKELIPNPFTPTPQPYDPYRPLPYYPIVTMYGCNTPTDVT